MERTATADTTASCTPLGPPLPRTGDFRNGDLLEAMPAQPGHLRPLPAAAPVTAPVSVPRRRHHVLRGLRALGTFRPWHLLPTPSEAPFTFGYAMVLAVTSVITQFADPALVYALQQSSSTDVAHLLRTPGTVLLASALWVAGGLVSPFVLAFLLVLTALERRTGARCTASVFLLGHVLATLLTEGTVGVAVLVGHLPETSLHRLDYGISFGVAASVGALAGLLRPRLRWPLLAVFGGMLVEDLLEFTDPMTNWGHLIALAIGVATWPLVRRSRRAGVIPSGPAASPVSSRLS